MKGAIITADAMSCLQKVAKAITAKDADYALQLKANQAKLLRETQAYFHKVRRDAPELIKQGYNETTDAGHARLEVRNYTQLSVTDWFEQREGWANLQYWGIENSLHHVLDVTFREDDSRIRATKGAQNMAVLKRFALNLIKQSGMKSSVKSILKQAAWNDKAREKIINL